MTLNDTLSNALSQIVNCEKIGRKECLIKPASKIILEVLNILNKRGYIGSFKIVADGNKRCIVLNLLGSVNKCGSIKPRYGVKKGDFEKFEARYLPAKGFGFLIVSTSKGIMTYNEAIENGIGGKLLAYCY